jgi:hypothetical protein
MGIGAIDVSVDEEAVEGCPSSCFAFGLNTSAFQLPCFVKM